MNKTMLTGRLAKDPEIRYTQTGVAVGSFTIAIDREFADPVTNKRECDFIPCVVWGKSAEFLGNNFHKGKWIEASGRLQVRSYNANDGSKRYVTEVVCDRIGFVGASEKAKDAGSAVPAGSFDEEIPF